LKIKFVIILIFNLIWNGSKGADPFTINLNSNTPVQFCTSPILVARDLTIAGIPTIPGIKISISEGFISGEDELLYNGKLTQSQPTPGTLELTGSSYVQDYIDAIRSVTYNNTKSIPTPGPRKITISLNDVDYLPATGHFYRYVSNYRISWLNAKTDAESAAMMYYGLKGYLATITSQVENDFIKLKTKGVGWIGASDANSEGEWRWVTGPEGLEDSGRGRLFWNGKGLDYNNNVAGTGPYLGQFNNWNNNEPNDTGGNEDYAHILFSSSQSTNQLRWNDLPNGGGTGSSDTPQGYLIEFGGYPDDPELHLSATLDLQVNTLNFKTNAIAPICEGVSVTLNQPDNSAIPIIYSWSPGQTLSSASVANPVATPKITTTYTLTGARGTCVKIHDFAVPVIPKPTVIFSIDSTTCYGYNLDVAYLGDANPAVSKFTWFFGTDTIANGIGVAKVNIPLGVNQSKRSLALRVEQNGCVNKDSIVNIHVKPSLSPWSVKDTLLCLSESFAFSVSNPDPSVHYDWNFGDGEKGSGTTPTHRYRKPGNYDIQLTITNNQKCTNTALVKDMIYAAALPVASFTMSDSIVYNDQPTVNFLNSSSGAIEYKWDFGDETTSSEKDPVHNFAVTGYRTVFLKVSSEFNCIDSVSHQVLIAFDRIFPPNGFSPNATEAIDRVFLLNSVGITSEGYDFKVFSRWSDLVFESMDEINGWDGKMKNGDWAPGGTYLWILNYIDFLGRKHRQTGSVTLVY
jgi:PKD repeat protein